MPHSHHSHSGQFCKHAFGELEEVVKEAIRQRFEVYGLTEHVPRYRQVDLYPEEENLTIKGLTTQFTKFIEEAHRLKSAYASKITLLVGLETEYISGLDLQRLETTLTTFGDQVEFLVGSIHHVNGIPIDFDEPTYERALASCSEENEEDAQEAFLSAYFEAQYELLQRFKPEIIGHFDLCRLYCPSLRFRDYPSVWRKIERNIRYAVDYGALFEVNAAAFRKKWNTAYPGQDVIKAVLGAGGLFALSDDSHGPSYVGLNYHRIRSYLQDMGISEIYYLLHSIAQNSAGRSIQAVRLDGDWLAHEFWRQRS